MFGYLKKYVLLIIIQFLVQNWEKIKVVDLLDQSIMVRLIFSHGQCQKQFLDCCFKCLWTIAMPCVAQHNIIEGFRKYLYGKIGNHREVLMADTFI